MKNILYLLCGIPGSGKSFVAKKLAADNDAVYLSADDIRQELTGDASDNTQNARVFGTLFGRLKKAFVNKQNVCIDNTNYNRKNRKEILALAKRANYEVYCYEMSTPHKISMERNKKRDRVVPDDVMNRMIANYQKPDPSIEYIHKIVSV